MRTLVVRKESVKSASWRAEDSHAGRFTSGVSHVFPFARVPFSFHFEYNCDVVLAPRERKGRRRAIEASRDVSSDRCWRTASGKKECVFLNSASLSPQALRDSITKTYRAASAGGVGAHDAGLESESHDEEVGSAGGG